MQPGLWVTEGPGRLLMAGTGKFSTSKRRAIAALLVERTNRAAAKVARVSERSLARWLKEPDFQEELRSQEAALVEHATRRLTSLQDAAIDAIQDALALADAHERADLGQFFKPSTRWTENPLPGEEIIGRRITPHPLVEDLMITEYEVKTVVLDMDALLDPEKSHLVKRFISSPQHGLGINVHDAQSAAGLKLRGAQVVLELLLKYRELNSLEQRIRALEEAYAEP